MRYTMLFVVAACLVATPLASQPRGLRHSTDLGEQNVGDTLEHDVLAVAGNGPYSQIRLCAFHKPVRLFGATVKYDDGTEHTLRAARRGAIIPRSGCTNWLRLGGQKTINAVHLSYWAEYFGPNRADVNAYGR